MNSSPMNSSATDIKAADVQKLRQITGAGLMDCKQALVESKGDMDKAIVILREKGIARSSKRADRVAAEGTIESWISPDAKQGILLEINCETDFVARNPEFVDLAKATIQLIKSNPAWTTAESVPAEPALQLSAKVGEKISVRRFAHFRPEKEGAAAAYIHPGSKLGVLLQIDADKPVGNREELVTLAKEFALQVAGANPTYISRDQIPADIIEREKDIAKKQMEGQNKPPQVLEKIAVGKLQQFYEANCLVDQPHVRDASGKTRIQDLLNNLAAKSGASLKIARFSRFRVGAD